MLIKISLKNPATCEKGKNPANKNTMYMALIEIWKLEI